MLNVFDIFEKNILFNLFFIQGLEEEWLSSSLRSLEGMQEALEHDCDSASKIKNLMKSFAYLATSLKTT